MRNFRGEFSTEIKATSSRLRRRLSFTSDERGNFAEERIKASPKPKNVSLKIKAPAPEREGKNKC